MAVRPGAILASNPRFRSRRESGAPWPGSGKITPPDAIILAGGRGTRLAHLLPGLPKPLAPVAGKPFLFHLLDLLAGTGIQRAVLSLGYEARQIEDAIKTYHRLQLSCVTERAALGTGGGLRQALAATQGETLLALNGDSMTPFDLTGFLDFHQKGGWTVSLAAVAMEDCARFGRLDLAGGGGVLSFLEKQDSGAGIINAGIYLVKRSLLDSLPLGQPLSFERDVLEPLTRQGKLGAFPCPGPFIDIGTPESLAAAERLVPDIMDRIGS